MTPVLVVDNSGRIVCRAQIRTEAGRAVAHLQFSRLPGTVPEPDQAVAARKVADIQRQVREQLAAADRRRRRAAIVAGLRHAATSGGLFLGLLGLSYVAVFVAAWGLAQVFGFEL